MSRTDGDSLHCKRCGAAISPGIAVCGLCGGSRGRAASNAESKEPWLMPPPRPKENPYKAPVGLDELPPSALGVLPRIFLTLLGIGAVVLSTIIAFFAACFTVGISTNSLAMAMLAGLIVAGFVGFFAIRAFNVVYRKSSTPRADR